jgi:hypothetical protein
MVLVVSTAAFTPLAAEAKNRPAIDEDGEYCWADPEADHSGWYDDGEIKSCCWDDGCWICDSEGYNCVWDPKYGARIFSPVTGPAVAPGGGRPPRGPRAEPSTEVGPLTTEPATAPGGHRLPRGPRAEPPTDPSPSDAPDAVRDR